MAHSAYLPIIADRYGAVVRHIFVVGLDLTGLDQRAQVRLYGDVPGAPLVDLLTVGNGNAQGLRLVEVTTDDAGLPTSHVELVINETTMEALPYAGEIGDVTTLAWDWQVTIAGRKRRLAKGEFQITGDGVTGADVAPVNRIAPYGLPQRPVADVWSSARMTFGEEQVSVTIDGADLVAPLAKKADDAAARAASDAQTANLAAGSAQAVSRYFTTRAAGEAASAIDQAFATDDGAGNVIYYKRTSGGSTEIGRAVTPAGLAAPAGSDLIGFAQNGGPRRSSLSKMRDSVSIKDFGAIGDGFQHPLSEFFSNLTEARAEFPGATSMTDLIDGLAIQKALAWAKENFREGRGELGAPSGFYRGNTGSFRLHNWIRLVGDGPGATVIDNQNTPVDYPLLVNDDPTSFLYALVRGMSFLGGSYGLAVDVTSEVTGLMIDDIQFHLQSQANVQFNKMLQLSTFNRIVFGKAPDGLRVLNPTTNAVDFNWCSWQYHSGSSLSLNGAELVNINGGRMEHGGIDASGKYTIYLEDAGPINIRGLYMEATHRILLKEVGSRGGVLFDGCRFTGARYGDVGDFVPYAFETDGIVHFGTNNWFLRTVGPERVHLIGNNQDKLIAEKVTYSKLTRDAKTFDAGPVVVPASGAINILKMSRLNAGGGANNYQMLTGELRVSYNGISPAGFPRIFSRTYDVVVTCNGTEAMDASIKLVSSNDQVSGPAATLEVKKASASASQLVIQAAFTGVDASTDLLSSLKWSFDYLAQTTLEDDYINADVF